MPAEQTNIKVVVRVRPYNRRELEQNQRCVIKVMDNTTLLFDPDIEDDEFFYQGVKQTHRDVTKRVNKKLSMEFDRIFDTDASNTQIFEECTSPLVDGVLNGYNCSVFVYGATGAGKTFTMLGSDTCPGLTYLTMRDLFDKMQAQNDNRKFDVGVSYLEVYNEQVMNLLTKSGPLKLREDSHGVVVSGLILKPIHSAEELLEFLSLGNSNRTQHPTDANSESSRSHAIFQVHIRMTDRKTGTKRTVKLSMIDLAGSERAASTKGIGLRFKEGASINKSLLALGNCINNLADGLKHIPYRDSNLTRILKDSLGGNCQTLMVANVSMSSLTYEDSYNTLKYASRAKKIRTALRQNVLRANMPKDFYVKKVNEHLAENDRLKETIKALEAKMALIEKSASNATVSRGFDENELKPWYSKIDAVYSAAIKTQEYVIGLQSKIMTLKLQTKHREEAEDYKKLLYRNSNDVQEVCVDYAASISRYSKQIGKQEAELTRWRKKLDDAYNDLSKLKAEINDSKYVDILKIYQKSKDLEVLNSKQNIKINHISGINSELISNSYKLREAFILASDVLQKSHEQLKANHIFSSELQKGFEQLQHIIKRAYRTDEEFDFQEVGLVINGKHPLTKEHDNSKESNSATKRQRLRFEAVDLGLDLTEQHTDLDDDYVAHNDGVFKVPRNLNETHVISASNATNDYNSISQYNAAPTLNTTITKGISNKSFLKTNLVSSILSEDLVRMPQNKEQLSNVLLKSKNFSHQGLLKTVAAGVQKENQKHSPNRVVKSPRNIMSKALASTTNLVKKQTIRTVPTKAEPIVRTNRAATFRVKK